MSLISIPSLVAEVQAHSSQQSQEEMDLLREQLLDAFRQQMQIRKSLMELENNNMEIQIATSNNLLTITESVSSLFVMFLPSLTNTIYPVFLFVTLLNPAIW